MTTTTNALLIYVIFLCWLEETVLSQHGHCVGKQCFALFQEPEDFQSARKRCKGFEGQLLMSIPQQVDKILSGMNGSYWLQLDSTGEAAAALQDCSSITVTTGQNFTLSREPCSEKLNGFLCQYTIDDPCSGLQTGAGAHMKYTWRMGFEVKDSETFPQGTIAIEEKLGAKYIDSRHLCYNSTSWLRAPWNCEVFQGGCEQKCLTTTSTTHTCTCPAGHTLHANKISCIADPCASCAQSAQECQKEGDTYACRCKEGYRLAPDGGRCVDVDECKEQSPCTREGEECENTKGSYLCRCKEGFDDYDGVCEDFSNCQDCEHMKCEKFNGVYECVCKKGYRVSAKDKTKCEQYCPEKDCLAICIHNPETVGKEQSCSCPKGYLKNEANGTIICTDMDECDQGMCYPNRCENNFGSYRCFCDEGFRLKGESQCVPLEDYDEDYGGSGLPPPHPTPVRSSPSAVPSYIKTGSVLGITMFMALCAALLYFLVHNAAKRCGKFDLTPLKRPDIDIFYLNQVTTETYKRLSFDKQSQIL